MKEYKYKSKMFYLHENDTECFENRIKTCFEDVYKIDITSKKNKFIDLNVSDNNNSVNLKFIYNPVYFIKCYEFKGIYSAEIFKGSKNIIKDIFCFLDKFYENITCRDPLYCANCGELIGYYFNHSGKFRHNVTPLITNTKQNKNDLYDSYEVFACEDCQKYFCEDCMVIDHNYDIEMCIDCFDALDTRTDAEKERDEEEFIQSYSELEFDDCIGICKSCNHYEECKESADDARDGETTFEDMVLSGGYDSVDDFWECNGI